MHGVPIYYKPSSLLQHFLRTNKPKQMAYGWSQDGKKKMLSKGKCAPTDINLSVSQLFHIKGSQQKMLCLEDLDLDSI